MFNEQNIGDSLRLNNQYFGFISKVLNWTTIELEPRMIDGKPLAFNEPIILNFEDADIVNNSFQYEY